MPAQAQLPHHHGGDFGGRGGKWECGEAVGKDRASAQSALLVDAEAGTTQLLGDFGGRAGKWRCGVAVSNGCMVFAPANERSILAFSNLHWHRCNVAATLCVPKLGLPEEVKRAIIEYLRDAFPI